MPASVHLRVVGRGGLGSSATQLMRAVSQLLYCKGIQPQYRLGFRGIMPDMETFPEIAVEVAFPVLERYGFHVARQEYRHEMFGNGFVDFEKRDLAIRLTRDRSQVLGDVGLRSLFKTEWHDLTYFINAADPTAAFQYEFVDSVTGRTIDTRLQLQRVVGAIDRYLPATLKGDRSLLKEVKRLEEEFVEEHFGKFLRKRTEDTGKRY